MNRVLIASHGYLADGIKSSLEIIMGKQDGIDTIDAYVDGNVDYNKVISDYLKNFDFKDNRLFVLTDLFGGSVNNEFMKYLDKYDFKLISGINLATALNITISLQNLNQRDTLEAIFDDFPKTLIDCNKIKFDQCDNDF